MTRYILREIILTEKRINRKYISLPEVNKIYFLLTVYWYYYHYVQSWEEFSENHPLEPEVPMSQFACTNP